MEGRGLKWERALMLEGKGSWSTTEPLLNHHHHTFYGHCLTTVVGLCPTFVFGVLPTIAWQLPLDHRHRHCCYLIIIRPSTNHCPTITITSIPCQHFLITFIRLSLYYYHLFVTQPLPSDCHLTPMITSPPCLHFRLPSSTHHHRLILKTINLNENMDIFKCYYV